MTDTASLLIYTTYRLARDDADAFEGIASRMRAAAIKRDGCIFLDVSRDIEEPATFRLVEGWRDQAALNAHFASDEFKSVVQEASALKITSRSGDIYTVSDVASQDMPS